MPPPNSPLVIDARPLGPSGPLAAERVRGRPVLAHLLDLALPPDAGTVVVVVRPDDRQRLWELLPEGSRARVTFETRAPGAGAAVLRSDRLYDRNRLRRALRRGQDPERAVLWRLDGPEGLAGAEDELTRRQTYQPLGRFWALAPARALARRLRPTRVRPNALTLTSGALMLAAAAGVAFAPAGLPAQLVIALALALALVLDTADGHLARLQGTASEFGRGLDVYLDELGDMSLHAATAWAAYVRSGHAGWLLVGMLYGMGKYQFVTGTSAWGREHETRGETPTPTASTDRNISSLITPGVRLAGHADVRWHLWIVLAAVGRLDVALAAYSLYYPARSLAGVARKAVRRG